MATRELYRRQYAGNVSVEIRVYRDQFSVTVHRPNAEPKHIRLHSDKVTGRYTEAQAAADDLAVAAPESSWQRVLECPVCDARDVEIQRHAETIVFRVRCPQCGDFDISDVAFTVLADVREGQTGNVEDLVALQSALADGVLRDGDVLTAENWLGVAHVGKRGR